MKNLFAFLIMATLLQSCNDNTFDVTDGWNEFTTAICLMDKNDTTHYLRIGKAFLDKNRSALEIAKIQDSLYYQNLQVVITEVVNNNVVRTFNATPTVALPKDTGVFAAPNQVLYYFQAVLNPQATYNLTITTPTGNVVKGSNNVVNGTFLRRPLPSTLINWSKPDGSQIDFYSPVNGKIYEVYARIHYYNTRKADGALLGKYYATTRLSETMPYADTEGYKEYSLSVYGGAIFKALRNQITPDPAIERTFLGVEFVFSSGDQNIANYIEINSPSNTIVQVKPNYSTLTNGLGIFASRYTYPNLRAEQAKTTYPQSSPTFRYSDVANGHIDSLVIKYPELNFKR
jgi:hypothetical protein